MPSIPTHGSPTPSPSFRTTRSTRSTTCCRGAGTDSGPAGRLRSAGREGPDEPGESLPPEYKLAAELFYGDAKPVPFLSDALREYRDIIREGDGSKGFQGRQNAVGLFMQEAGDMQLDQYTRHHARDFVNALRDDGKSDATVKRYVGYISPVFTTAISEHDLQAKNIFQGLRLPANGQGTKKREPFTTDEIGALQALCRQKDDELRWLVALVSDTEMRLAEAAGLEVQDIVVHGEVPHVRIRENRARSLKTPGSDRQVPLVGCSLWAAKRIVGSVGGKFAFPRYTTDGECKATHASNTLNKWIKSHGIKKTVHSFRHSLRDRLREVDAPSEVADAIGGWATKGVGQSYGQGRSLSNLRDWMEKIVLAKQPDLKQAGE